MAAPPLDEDSGVQRLDGWNAIASYLQRDEKTVRHWYKQYSLPVHREFASRRSRVFAYASEIDLWRKTCVIQAGHSRLKTQDGHKAPEPEPPPSKPRTAWWLSFGALAVSVFLVLLLAHYRTPVLPPFSGQAGRFLAAATSEGSEAIAVDVPVRIGGVVASPDGEHAFVFEHQKDRIYWINVSNRETRTLAVNAPIGALTVSRDGKTLYCGLATRGLRIIELPDGKSRDIALDGGVSDLVLSPDGGTLYAALGQRGVRRISLETSISDVITLQRAPFFIALDRSGLRLFATYQNGGPGGREGHDTVGAFDLSAGSVMTSASGPPLVGGPPAISPATGDVWVQMWDACVTKSYDGQGCPDVPSYGFQIFRSEDLKFVRSQTWSERVDTRVHFPGDGTKAVIPGPSLRIVDSTRFRTSENGPIVSWAADSSADGRRVFILGPRRLLVLEPVPSDCYKVTTLTAQEFPFDGSLGDAIEATEFRSHGPVQFIRGRVGQAIQLGAGGSLRMRSPSTWRFGDEPATHVSFAMWFRTRGPGVLLQRNSYTPWTLDWRDGMVRLGIGNDMSMEASAPSGQWHHVVISRTDSQYEMFLNGRPVARGSAQPDDRGSPSAEFSAEGEFDMDELMLFAERLSESDIRKLASMTAKGHCESKN